MTSKTTYLGESPSAYPVTVTNSQSFDHLNFMKTHQTAMKILGVLGLITGTALLVGGSPFLGAFYIHTVIPICVTGLLTSLVTLIALSALSKVIKQDSKLQETFERAKVAALAGAVTFGLGISPLGPVALSAAPGLALIYYSLEALKSVD